MANSVPLDTIQAKHDFMTVLRNDRIIFMYSPCMETVIFSVISEF